MSAAAIIRDLIAAGVDGELVARVAQEILDAAKSSPANVPMALEKRRAYDRERKSATPTPYGDHAWLMLRAAVIERDGRECAYCDDHDDALTADHIIPLSRGGAHDARNLICCCVPCNNSKRNLLLTEWPGRSTTRRHRPFDHIVGLAVADA